MSTIKEVLEQATFQSMGPVGTDVIKIAEQDLHIQFALSYREFVENYGAMSIGSHEIFGLGVGGYMNVVESTQSERTRYPGALDQCIVIENLSIEGILIVINQEGQVFEFHNENLQQIAESFTQYVESLIS